MITIELLENHKEHIQHLAYLWREELGKVWLPDLSIEYIEQLIASWTNADALPLAYVAFKDGKLAGVASLQEYCGVRSDLGPWLGSLVVAREYQRQRIGKILLNAISHKARELKFRQLYLFTFDVKLCTYYERLGWSIVAQDEFHQRPVTIMEIMI